MKSLALQPTTENLLKTFTEDSIRRDETLLYFLKLLNQLDDSCSIALDGNWGSGKTFFVKQAKMVLDTYNEHICKEALQHENEIKSTIKKLTRGKDLDFEPQLSIYYDAWENDNDTDPVLSIVDTILTSTQADYSFNVPRNLIDIVSAVVDCVTTKSMSGIIRLLKAENYLSSIHNKNNLQELISDFLDSVLQERGNRLILFVDELDRCSPDFAVLLLERIKHYFSNEKITFVFSINARELEHTIKKHYGEEFDAGRYLDRFFDLRVSLPPIDYKHFLWYMNYPSGSYIYDMVAKVVMEKYRFEMREVCRYTQLLKIAAYSDAHNLGGIDYGQAFCLCCVVPIMIGLKISNANEYQNFITGNNPEPLTDILCTLDRGLFSDFLKIDEVFETTQNMPNGTKIVALKDRLSEAYRVIFNGKHAIVGRVSLDEDSYKCVHSAASLLSRYADYDN